MMLIKTGRFKRILKILLIIAFWAAIWQAASMIVDQPLYMPSPAETFKTLWGLFFTFDFWLSIAFTFYRVILGLVISFAAGVTLAYLSSRWKALQSILGPAVAAAKSVPVVSIIILALVWFNSSFVPVFSCVLLCFPIFYTNTLSGIKSIDKELLEMAAVFRVKHKRIVYDISIPSVLPNIYSALSICLGFSWKSVVAAEALSSPDYSMGFSLLKTKNTLDTPALFAWTITIIIISIIVEKVLKRILPGGNRL